MSLVGLLMFVLASTTGCAVGMNANRPAFGGHVDPSIAVERTRAFDAQPWGFASQPRSWYRTGLRALFDFEASAAYWRHAIAAAERIPEAKPVTESVPSDVLDRLDAGQRNQLASSR
jgi:hypothetical protein